MNIQDMMDDLSDTYREPFYRRILPSYWFPRFLWYNKELRLLSIRWYISNRGAYSRQVLSKKHFVCAKVLVSPRWYEPTWSGIDIWLPRWKGIKNVFSKSH